MHLIVLQELLNTLRVDGGGVLPLHGVVHFVVEAEVVAVLLGHVAEVVLLGQVEAEEGVETSLGGGLSLLAEPLGRKGQHHIVS